MAHDEPDVAGELRAELVGPEIGGPREDPGARVHVVSRRPRPARSGGFGPETFADHYSQARQFYVSQTPVEQQHIADAFVFELSKVERPDIRVRMVAQPAQRRRRTRRRGGRRARSSTESVTAVDAGAPADHGPAGPSPALSILRNATGIDRRAQGRVLVTRRQRREDAQEPARGGRRRRARRSSSSHPRSAA